MALRLASQISCSHTILNIPKNYLLCNGSFGLPRKSHSGFSKKSTSYPSLNLIDQKWPPDAEGNAAETNSLQRDLNAGGAANDTPLFDSAPRKSRDHNTRLLTGDAALQSSDLSPTVVHFCRRCYATKKAPSEEDCIIICKQEGREAKKEQKCSDECCARKKIVPCECKAPVIVMTNVPLVRLKKFHFEEEPRECKVDCAEEIGLRADDCIRPKEKKLPKLELNDCDPVKQMAILDEGKPLKRLPPFHFEITRKVCVQPCEEVTRADDGLTVERKCLPPLDLNEDCLPPCICPPMIYTKPMPCCVNKTIHSRWPAKINKRRFHTGIKKKEDECKRKMAETEVVISDRSQSRKRKGMRCVLDIPTSNLKPRIPPPYPAFSECGFFVEQERDSECFVDDSELQPMKPLLRTIVHLEPPEPKIGKVDPSIEEKCLRIRCKIPSCGRKASCGETLDLLARTCILEIPKPISNQDVSSACSPAKPKDCNRTAECGSEGKGLMHKIKSLFGSGCSNPTPPLPMGSECKKDAGQVVKASGIAPAGSSFPGRRDEKRTKTDVAAAKSDKNPVEIVVGKPVKKHPTSFPCASKREALDSHSNVAAKASASTSGAKSSPPPPTPPPSSSGQDGKSKCEVKVVDQKKDCKENVCDLYAKIKQCAEADKPVRHCPSVTLPGCPPRCRDTCQIAERPNACERRLAPYPAFSECKKFNFTRAPCSECNLALLRQKLFKDDTETDHKKRKIIDRCIQTSDYKPPEYCDDALKRIDAMMTKSKPPKHNTSDTAMKPAALKAMK